MYERLVETPRLYAVLGEDGPIPPLVSAMQRTLSARYQEPFTRISLGYYRNGQDSVAFHGDRIARTLPNALVATVSVGAARRFLMRPRAAANPWRSRSGGGICWSWAGRASAPGNMPFPNRGVRGSSSALRSCSARIGSRCTQNRHRSEGHADCFSVRPHGGESS